MWLRSICLPLMMFTFQVSFPSDTAQTMRQKYGLPISETYLARPGVAASVRFGASGHACEIVVSPDEPGSVKRLQTFTRQQLTEVIDELVPESERGKPMFAGFFNGACLPDNACAGTISGSQKVSIYMNGEDDSERYATIQWTRGECHPK